MNHRMPASCAVMMTEAEATRRDWPDWISRNKAEGTGLGLTGWRPGIGRGRVLGKERRSARGIVRVVVLGLGKKTWPGRKRSREAREMRGSV